jgi:hypothetical protein
MSPYIIFCEDNNGRVNRIFIATEKRILMEADDFLAAVSSLMSIYTIFVI